MAAHPSAHKVTITFGKYNGQSLGKIYEINPGYLTWMANEATMKEPWRSLARRTANQESIEELIKDLPEYTITDNIKSVDKITIQKLSEKSNKRCGIYFPKQNGNYNTPLITVIDGIKYEQTKGCFSFPIPQIVRVINLLGGLSPEIDIDSDCLEYYTNEIDRSKLLQSIREKDKLKIVNPLEIPTLLPLRDYQKNGIEFIEAAGNRVLVADVVGLGKTVTALGYTLRHPGKTLIIVPKNIKLQWQQKIKEFIGVESCIWDTKGPEGNYSANYHITHYNIIDRFIHDFNNMELTNLICDECTYMTNYKAKRTMAIIGSYQYRKTYPGINSENVILMSGTPMKNKPRELFTLCNYLDDQRFQNPAHFVKRYEYGEVKFNTDKSKYTNLPELYDRISELMIRRDRSIRPLEKLPERYEILIEMDDDDRRQYNELLESLSIKWEMQSPSAVDIVPIRRFLFKLKWERLIEFTTELVDSNKSVLIFTFHPDHAERLGDHYKDLARVVHGGIKDDKKREKYKLDLIDKKAKIGIYTLGTGGMGIDGLQYAISDAIFAERAWTPADHEQAEGRIARDGQKEVCYLWYMTVQDTIDIIHRDLLAQKEKSFGEAVEGKIYDGFGIKSKDDSFFKDFVQLLGKQMKKEFNDIDDDSIINDGTLDSRYYG